MRKLYSLVLLTAVNLVFGAAGGKGESMEEYRVKALFLYNFTQFVEWPQEAFKAPGDPLTICVLAPSPFERGELEQALSGKRFESHPLVSRLISDPSQSTGCHIVFIGATAARRARAFVAGPKQPGLLTVGENPGFAEGGGVVNFLIREGRVRLEINIGAAERERLRISAKLLKLAEIVK